MVNFSYNEDDVREIIEYYKKIGKEKEGREIIRLVFKISHDSYKIIKDSIYPFIINYKEDLLNENDCDNNCEDMADMFIINALANVLVKYMRDNKCRKSFINIVKNIIRDYEKELEEND